MASSVRPDMSNWKEEKAERNRRSLVRLTKVLPPIFPSAVLSRALGQPFIPPTPRLAIESYWRAHSVRADRLARALAARTGPPTGWTWRISQSRKTGLPATFRTPPAGAARRQSRNSAVRSKGEIASAHLSCVPHNRSAGPSKPRLFDCPTWGNGHHHKR